MIDTNCCLVKDYPLNKILMKDNPLTASEMLTLKFEAFKVLATSAIKPTA